MGNLCAFQIGIDTLISDCRDCIVGQACYTCKLKGNHKALTRAGENLEARRNDVSDSVARAEQQFIKRSHEVQLWLRRAETTITEAKALTDGAPGEIEKLCLAGCFSKDCKSSYKFGKQVARKLKETVVLWNEGDFDKIGEKEAASKVERRPSVPTVGLGSTLSHVRSSLEDNNVGIIGLYGLGGVGKTTLLTEINNILCDPPVRYDVVIWVESSRRDTVENVQEKIWEKIRPSDEAWKKKGPGENALDIYKILCKRKFVLLLDDVWICVNLKDVGIPYPSPENGSKVVLTTRLSHVCREMGAQPMIEVKCLGKTEAWTLFQQKVSEDIFTNSDPEVREIAESVAAECGGLPLAIDRIGREMTDKTKRESWDYAEKVLKNSAHKFEKTGEIYSVLSASYENLLSDKMKSCFLYCSLFPEGSPILKSSLINYWFCEGLLDMFESINDALTQGHYIIEQLVSANLLQQDEKDDYVKLHDVIRDMALWIACECEAAGKRLLVQAGLQLTKAPEVGNWKDVRRMSLMQNEIKNLSFIPRCPKIETLFLNKNDLQVIEDGFFRFMPNLRVLNLSGNRNLTSLPEGISKLVSLECLDLSSTGLRELPIKLKSLSKLKLLNLKKMENMERIPQQLIRSFSKLQVFRINESDSSCLDETEEGNVLKGGNEGLIEELGCLQNLNMLSIHIGSTFALERFLSSHNLRGCMVELWLHILSESQELNVISLANMKLERLNVNKCERMTELMRIQIPTNTPCFDKLGTVEISFCDNLKDMTWLILAPNLKSLTVGFCQEMGKIMSKRKLSEVANVVGDLGSKPFDKLQSLWLNTLPQLESIYQEALPFPCLTDVVVISCSNLMKLPFNSDSGKKISIKGDPQWWNDLKWDNGSTESPSRPCFQPV